MNFTQAVRRAAQISPDRVSTVCGERQRSWAETLDRVRRLAGSLRRLGVASGDRVVILALNSDRYLEAMYAVAWSGGVFVPLNTRWSGPELAYAVNHCRARIAFADDEFLSHAAALRSQGLVDRIVYLGDGPTPPDTVGHDDLAARGEPCGDAGRRDDELCGIFYTGGTTGHPKGVMLSNRNIIFASLNWLSCLHVSRETIYMHAAGFFHLGGASPAFATTLAGGTNVILPKFGPRPAMAAIRRHRVNYALFVPVMLNNLLSDETVAEYDLTSVRDCHYGGSPMPEALLRKAMEVLPGWAFHQGYGLTETTAVVTVLGWADHAVSGPAAGRLVSAGQASPGWEVRVVGQSGDEVPRGTVGEVVARGAGIMLGYLDDPEATGAVIRDGWFHTGDVGHMDEGGFLFVVDRMKDMIISGGENIYSTEVENALHRHPAVRECAVIGVPDDIWGETVHAVVVPHAGAALTEDELVAHCRSLIAGYKCPRSIEITPEPLPVSPAGKITKNALRDRFWSRNSRRVN